MKNDKHDKHEHDKQITRPICSIMAAAVLYAARFFAIGKKDEREVRLFFVFITRDAWSRFFIGINDEPRVCVSFARLLSSVRS